MLLCVKSHQTAAALDDLAAHAPATTPVVSVQNGVANERAILRRFARTYAVCVMLPSGHLEPGVVAQKCHPTPGILDVGCFPRGVDELTETIAEDLRRGGFESVPRPDIMAWKYRKLIRNLGNGIDAVCAPGDGGDEPARLAAAEGELVLATAGIPAVTEAEDDERRGDILRSTTGHLAARRVHLAERAAWGRGRGDRLPVRRGGAARPAARRTHSGQRAAPAGDLRARPTGGEPRSLAAGDLLAASGLTHSG